MPKEGGLKACLKGCLEGWGETLFWSKWAGGQHLKNNWGEKQCHLQKSLGKSVRLSYVAKVLIHWKQIKDICAVKSSLSEPVSHATNITSVRKETYVLSQPQSPGANTLLEMDTEHTALWQGWCGKWGWEPQPGCAEQPSLLILSSLGKTRYLWIHYSERLPYVHYHRNLSQKYCLLPGK